MTLARAIAAAYLHTVPGSEFMNNPAHIPRGGGLGGYCPIQKLPPELLCDIFHHSVPHPKCRPEVIILPYPSVTEAPLKLGRICRSWRKFVLSDSSLWTELSLGANIRRPSLDLVILGEWLARSQQSPISLAIKYVNPDYDVDDVDRLMAKVISCSNRWKYLELNLPSQCNWPSFTPLFEASPNLKVLHIHTKGGDPVKIDLTCQPSLTDLTLFASVQFASNHSPMRNIRKIRIAFPTIDNYFRCLDLCSSVEEVKYYFSFTIDFRPSISEPMRILPSITKLSLVLLMAFRYHESLDFGMFMDRLQLPQLRALETASFLFMGDIGPWSHASDLLKRSNAKLESFKAENSFHDGDFCECLRQSPRLKMLLVGSDMMAKLMLDTLTMRSNPELPFICPQLEHVELDFCLTTMARCRERRTSVDPFTDSVRCITSFE
ncbi:hypothetical protein BD410DRAFT_791475 [Rickenella mellea]|uniref:Uncharacterized protein n=1 Tax=Rickenella mellea TaxID=50990 RepID=A0A4Y7PYK3_9AGAM|nr:hypothetical protein BD410DRAFT_791475 [Rickenella mellea]